MIHFPCDIFIKHIIHFIILCLDYHSNDLDSDWVHGNCQIKEVCYGWSLVGGINGRLFHDQKVLWDLGLYGVWILGWQVAYLILCPPFFFKRWYLCITGMRMLRVLDWGVILFDKILFVFFWLYSYNFYGVPIGYPIDIQNFTIQLWSNTPV